MLKALFKKQLMELFAQFFRSNKKGKSRTKSGIIGYTVMFTALCLFLAGVFAGMSFMLASALVPMKLGWLYFVLMSMIAMMLGVFGSVFNTYSTLYIAKDNELLLAMPIPPMAVLSARLFGVWFWGTFYELLVLVPATVIYLIVTGFSVTVLLSDIVLILVVSVLILVISCLLGWIIAKIKGRFKSKSIITVIVALVFLGVYYYFCSQATDVINNLLANAERIGENIRGSAYPIYLIGRVGEGDGTAVLIAAAVAIAIVVLMFRVLSRSFIKLVTTQNGEAKVKYRESNVKLRSASGAFLYKEYRHLLSSSTYMLNCGLGTVIVPALAVLVLIKGNDILPILNSIPLGYASIVPLIACAILCSTSTMNDLTAPSVSLEGKNIWLAQVLPISPWQALAAKLKMHLQLTMIPVLLGSASLVFVLKPDLYGAVMIFLIPQLFAVMMACLGLIINLKSPNLEWTNETLVVKQSAGVAIALFGGWAIIAALAGIYVLLAAFIGAELYMLICAVLFAVISALMIRWLKTKGSAIFAEL